MFVHWIIYNLPGISRELAEGVPKEPSLPNGAKQGATILARSATAALPPPGSAHHYFFRIYALDSGVNLPPGASKEELLVSMHNHILDQAELIGTYTAGRVPLEQAR